MSIPWVEKYRPRYLDDIIGQNEIITKLKSLVALNNIPHLLFVGRAGIGKTTTALALVREVQKNKMKKNSSYIELNASDDRGIDVVRGDIKNFAKMKPPSGLDYKFIILDECDSMTRDAQGALRKIMEQYSDICRFILICNFQNKIIEPIQSRTSLVHFKPITHDTIKKRLKYIALNEGVIISMEALDAIVNVSDGDLRQSINILQSCASLEEEITPHLVYSISGRLTPSEIRAIFVKAIENGFEESYAIVSDIIRTRGIGGRNLVRQMSGEVLNLDYDDEMKYKIFKILGETERNISEGGTEEVQLAAMIVKLSDLGEY